LTNHRFSRLLFPFAFVLLVSAIGAGGYFHYLGLKSSLRSDHHAALAFTADLKARQITQWVDAQRSQAELLRVDRLLIKEVRAGATRDLRAYLEALQQHQGYRSILLLNAKGTVTLAVGEAPRPLDDPTLRLAIEAAACGCVMLSEFQRDEQAKIHLDLLVPLKTLISGKERLVAVLLLRIDPQPFFYPLVQTWPSASPSAETQLLQVEGQDVIFLNALRHQPEAALTLRMPLESAELPAALMDRDRQAVVEGVDYRGIPVFAAVRPIPGTPWFMVVQVDARELFAPLAVRGRMILKVSLLLSFFAAVAVYFAWLHQKGATRQRETAQAERAAVDQHLKTWIESVSQELRAPLDGVDDCARQMQANVKERLEAASLAPLEQIRTHVRTMKRRIGDLLAFTRLSHSAMIPETIPMSALFQAVCDELRAAAPGRQMRLELRPLPSAQGDPALIRQVMHNLLDNALKFSRARKTSKIEIGCLPAHMGRSGYRTFYVKDNGVGFDMQNADKLFGIYQRLQDAQTSDGSGLGLAMVKQIVERHGGRVWAQSSVDEGAVFFFSLPSRDK